MPAIVLGRYPPPLDGQSIATERLASLLEPHTTLVRLDTAAQDNLLVSESHLSPQRILHAFRTRKQVKTELRAYPEAPVLWPSVSPSVLGHLRDRVSILSSLHKNQPVFGIIHTGRFSDLFKNRVTRRSALRCIHRLAGVVFLSQSLANDCAEWIPDEKRIVIPNTILDDLILNEDEVAEKQKSRLDDDEFRLLFLSNMIPSKGYEDVLDAVRILRDRRIAVKARFAGRWPVESAREHFFQKRLDYNLEKQVDILGGISDRKELKALHQWADAFILPTYYPVEAQPLTIIEAMNAGTPVITTNHSGIPEMLGNSEAIFVPPRSPEAVAEAVITLHDRDLWISKSAAARERFIDSFSPEIVARKWLDLLSVYQ